MVPNISIAIIGGGTSGLLLAALLQKAGYSPTVFEKAPELRAEGCGVMLRSMGLEVLGKASLKLQQDMIAAGMPVTKYDFRNLKGKTFQAFEASEDSGEATDAVPNAIVIDRGALARTLQDFAKDVKFEFNRPVTQVIDKPETAEVHFSDGSIECFDLVVGADGIFSKVRPAIENPEYFYFGDLVWRGVVSEGGDFCPPGSFIIYKRTKGLYANCYHIGDGKLHWAIYVERGIPTPVSDPSEVIQEPSYPSEGELSKLQPEFAKLVREMPQGEIVGRYSFDIAPLSTFKGKHVVLSGDAAHAQSAVNGAGVSLALLDAYTLAESLIKREDLESALDLYEQIALPIGHDFQNNSRQKSLAIGRTTKPKKSKK